MHVALVCLLGGSIHVSMSRDFGDCFELRVHCMHLRVFTTAKAHVCYHLTLTLVCPTCRKANSKPRSRGRRPTVGFEEAFLLCMIKLKCNFDFSHLGYLFDVTTDTASITFHRMLDNLSVMFDLPFFTHELDPQELLSAKPMECLKEFPDVVMILDCSEFFIQSPGKCELNKLFFSPYKHHTTVKILVGINKAGRVVYVSRCHPGRISDKQFIKHSKILEKMPKGSSVMVDKGFLIFDLASKVGVKVEMPPLASSSKQFSRQDLGKGRKIAASRIHIERAIQRGKLFRILSDEIKNTSMPYISKIVKVCFMLTNWQGELVLG
jgi:hypothetical protein